MEFKNTRADTVYKHGIKVQKNVRFLSPLKVLFSNRTKTQRIVKGIRTVWEFFFTVQSKEEPAPLLL